MYQKIGTIMKKYIIACLSCILPTSALAAEKYKISAVRMFDRMAADVSCSLFRFKVKEPDVSLIFNFYVGLGAVRWDDDRNGEGRVHADASTQLNSVYFSVGTFLTSGATGDPALGIRSTLGYQFHQRAFVGGYWEFAAGLPSTSRASRAGIGIQAGFTFGR
jgi:hypothetical protein